MKNKELPGAVFDAETHEKALQEIIRGLESTVQVRVGGGNYTQVPDYSLRVKCATIILDRNLGKPAQTMNVNKTGDAENKPKSPGELLSDLQGNLPLLRKVLANFADAMNTINVTPIQSQIGQGPDGESVGLGLKSPKNGEKANGV